MTCKKSALTTSVPSCRSFSFEWATGTILPYEIKGILSALSRRFLVAAVFSRRDAGHAAEHAGKGVRVYITDL